MLKHILSLLVAIGSAAQARPLPPSLVAPAKSLSLQVQSIYNGTVVQGANQAWQSTVRIRFENEAGNGGFCTGVFINSDTILTAAHCKVGNNRRLTLEMFRNGDIPFTQRLSGNEYRYQAHPNYEGNDSDDIAVIVLKDYRLPPDIGHFPAQLLTAGMESAADPGRNVFVVGAGGTELGNGPSSLLLYADGTIIQYTGKSIIEIEINGDQAICAGDSGGPVFAAYDGNMYLVGITSSTIFSMDGRCGTNLYVNQIGTSRRMWIDDSVDMLRGEL